MDENEAVEERQVATPIFNVYRRGYDPEQVDRYVADQQRRLDDALYRASESERRLAAAVGQLRELHRRVAVYESETRTAQPPSLDTLGERVQRILQEAWEGAYTLRQEAEREANELREAVAEEADALRESASQEAVDVVDQATRRALAIRDETERRRHAYLQRVEQDRERAVSQITYLYDQRQEAINELTRLQTTVQAVVEEVAHSPLGRPAPGVAAAAAVSARAGGGERTESRIEPGYGGRHAAASSPGVEPEYERDEVTAVGNPANPTELQRPTEQIPAVRRSESLFDAEAAYEDVPEVTRPTARRTSLFDAEEEGWT